MFVNQRSLLGPSGMIELAQECGEFLLFWLIESGEDLQDTFFKQRNCAFVKFGAFLREDDVNDATVIFVSLPNNQFLLFEPVNDSGQVADRHHHFGPDFTKRQSTGIANGREHVKLRRCQSNSFQILFQFLV